MNPLNVEYRPIPGVYGYAAGSNGTVQSIGRQIVRRDGRGGSYTAWLETRTLKPWIAGGGYLYAQLGKDGPKASVHRFVCMAFHGMPPIGKEVAHLDGNCMNNAADNLAWVTHSENEKHKQAHGTAPDYRTLRWGRQCKDA